MSVWVVCPSARPHVEAGPILNKWLDMGYKVAIQRNPDAWLGFERFDLACRPWQGYPEAMNFLVRYVLRMDEECDWVVCGADDTEPDPRHVPEEIARQCSVKFKSTFGVMQPTGDRFAGGSIDRICGSPWIGREFATRINQGKGPYWPEYRHMFCDEELQAVATQYGVLWQRPDLIHMHHHFMREDRRINANAVQRPIPSHLAEANSQAHWSKYHALFEQRKRAGFPGSEPL